MATSSQTTITTTSNNSNSSCTVSTVVRSIRPPATQPQQQQQQQRDKKHPNSPCFTTDEDNKNNNSDPPPPHPLSSCLSCPGVDPEHNPDFSPKKSLDRYRPSASKKMRTTATTTSTTQDDDGPDPERTVRRRRARCNNNQFNEPQQQQQQPSSPQPPSSRRNKSSTRRTRQRIVRQDEAMNDLQQRNYEEHLELARDFVQRELVLLANNNCHNSNHSNTTLFQLLRPALTNDPYLALAGLEAGVYQMSDLPQSLQSNKLFCLQVVARYSSLFDWSWQRVPSERTLHHNNDYYYKQQQQLQSPPPPPIHHHQSLDWNILPDHLQRDVHFARLVVTRRPEAWCMLPPGLQARSAEAIPLYNDVLAVQVLSSSSSLCHSETIWKHIVQSAAANNNNTMAVPPTVQGLYQLVHEFAPQSIRRSPIIMWPAYHVDHEIRRLWDESLWQPDGDEQPDGLATTNTTIQYVLRQDGLVALLDIPARCLSPTNRATTTTLSAVSQAMFHPDNSRRLFRQQQQDSLEDDPPLVVQIVDHLQAAGLWDLHNPTTKSTTQRLVQTWFQAGLPFVWSRFPQAWTREPDLWLCLARHNPDEYIRVQSRRGDRGSDDVALAYRVVQIQPSLLFFVATTMKATMMVQADDNDDDSDAPYPPLELVATALAHADAALRWTVQHGPDYYHQLWLWAQCLREQLQTQEAWETFVQQQRVLVQPLLENNDNNDNTTMDPWRQRVAEFLNLPTHPNWLPLWRRAVENIAYVFFSVPEDSDRDEDDNTSDDDYYSCSVGGEVETATEQQQQNGTTTTPFCRPSLLLLDDDDDEATGELCGGGGGGEMDNNNNNNHDGFYWTHDGPRTVATVGRHHPPIVDRSRDEHEDDDDNKNMDTDESSTTTTTTTTTTTVDTKEDDRAVVVGGAAVMIPPPPPPHCAFWKTKNEDTTTTTTSSSSSSTEYVGVYDSTIVDDSVEI